MSLNKVMLIGNVGRAPVVLSPEHSVNAKVATFTVATTERYRDLNGEMREIPEWRNMFAWRNSADVVERFVKKGTQLYIEGRIRTRSWDDQTGNKRYTTEILVDNLQLLGRKADNPASQGGYGAPTQSGYQSPQPYSGSQAGQPYGTQSYQQPVQPQAQPAAPAEDLPEDDLPF